jgi:hypothetical protein
MRDTTTELRDVLALLRAGHWNAAHDRVQQYEGLHAAWLHGLLHWQEGIWKMPRTGTSAPAGGSGNAARWMKNWRCSKQR